MMRPRFVVDNDPSPFTQINVATPAPTPVVCLNADTTSTIKWEDLLTSSLWIDSLILPPNLVASIDLAKDISRRVDWMKDMTGLVRSPAKVSQKHFADTYKHKTAAELVEHYLEAAERYDTEHLAIRIPGFFEVPRKSDTDEEIARNPQLGPFWNDSVSLGVCAAETTGYCTTRTPNGTWSQGNRGHDCWYVRRSAHD